MRLPRSDGLDLKARQLLCQGQRGDVRDPLVTLVRSEDERTCKQSDLTLRCRVATLHFFKDKHLPQVVFEAGDSLVQTQFVELVVATRQDFAGFGQKEGSVAAARHRGDTGAFGDLHLWETKSKIFEVLQACMLEASLSEVKKRFAVLWLTAAVVVDPVAEKQRGGARINSSTSMVPGVSISFTRTDRKGQERCSGKEESSDCKNADVLARLHVDV